MRRREFIVQLGLLGTTATSSLFRTDGIGTAALAAGGPPGRQQLEYVEDGRR